VTVVDPQTEEKKGRIQLAYHVAEGVEFPCGVKMRLARTRASRSLANPGDLRASRAVSRMSTSAVARPNF